MTKAQRNLLAILSMVDGVALTIEKTYRKRLRNKTVLAMCDRIHRVTSQAMDIFDLIVVDRKTFDALERKITRFEASTFANREYTAPILLSTILGLLDEPLRLVQDPKRKAALEQVERSLWALHKHFDRKLDKLEEYELATSFCKRW